MEARSFDDPLTTEQPADEAVVSAPSASPAELVASIEATMRAMLEQLAQFGAVAVDLQSQVAEIKADQAQRPTRAALPAVEQPSAEADGLVREIEALESELRSIMDAIAEQDISLLEAEQVVTELEAQIVGIEHRLNEAVRREEQARAMLENARNFDGAEGMVIEAERLVGAKAEERAAVENERSASADERTGAIESRDEIVRLLEESRSEAARIENEIRVLRGEEPLVAVIEEIVADEESSVGEPIDAEVQIVETAAAAEPVVFEDPLPALPMLDEEELPVAAPAPIVAGPVIEDEDEIVLVESPALEPLSGDEDEIELAARAARERLVAELGGITTEPAVAEMPAEEEEIDEEALRIARITEAEIAGETISYGTQPGTYDEDWTTEDAVEEQPVEDDAAALPAAMPWEQPTAQEPVPLVVEAIVPGYPEKEESALEQPTVMVPADHVPAYAGLEEEESRLTPPPRSAQPAADLPARIEQPPVASLPEPEDILWSIAQVPVAEDEPTTAPVRQIVQATRAAQPTQAKKKGQKPKFEALPFDILQPGVPLIAAFFSPSGGVGKSSTTLNAAALIAAIGAKQAAEAAKKGLDMRTPRVLVLDGDVVQGSLAMRLTGEIKPSMHTLQLYLDAREDANYVGRERWPQVYDISEKSSDPNEKAMKEFTMWPPKLDNLNLLAAPDDPDKFFDFGPDEFKELLELLGQHYDIILIDCGTEVVMESNKAWLQHAHAVFMLTMPEMDRIWNAGRAMGYIAKRRPDPEDRSENPRMLPPLVTREKVSVVLTSSDADTGIELNGEELVAEGFPYIDEKQRFFIPDVKKELIRANNQHSFLVLEDGRYSKPLLEIVKHMFNRYSSTLNQRR